MKNLALGDFKISVKTLQFLEPLLEKELITLGAKNIQIGKRIVHCTGDIEFLYRCNYQLRTALRVLVPIMSFNSRNSDDLYRSLKKFNWDDVLTVQSTFLIDSSVHSKEYKLPHFAALRMKDAIVDFFKDKYGNRPDIEKENPDVLFHLHIDEHKVTVSLDSSGFSLNKRGYRVLGGAAPLNEVLAAAMLQISEWNSSSDIYIPMCGGGTIAIEAAFIATHTPALFFNDSFAFKKWKGYDETVWKKVKQAALSKVVPIQSKIWAGDIDKKTLGIARQNIKNAGFQEIIELEESDFFLQTPASNSGVVVLNPPYGERIDPEQLEFFYKRIGDTLKKNWSGFDAWMITGSPEGLKSFGLKPSRKTPLMNGSIECRFCKYTLFKGSRAEHVIEKKKGQG